MKHMMISAMNKDVNVLKTQFKDNIKEKIASKISTMKQDITNKMFQDKENESD